MNDFLLAERRHFKASHYHSLPGFFEPRHGHNWELEVSVISNASVALGSALDAWVAGVNCSLLNEHKSIAGRNPTAEVLAEWLFHYLEEANLCPRMVKIREKSQYWAACIGYSHQT